MALELGINARAVTPRTADERQEREVLNRRRTWLACWTMESMRSFETGIAPIAPEDEVRHRSIEAGEEVRETDPTRPDCPQCHALVHVLQVSHRL